MQRPDRFDAALELLDRQEYHEAREYIEYLEEEVQDKTLPLAWPAPNQNHPTVVPTNYGGDDSP